MKRHYGTFAVGLGCILAVLAGLYYASPQWLAKSGLSAERARAGLEMKTVMAGGRTHVYLEGGTGPNLVLVHGFGGDKDNYTRLAAYLTESHHVVMPDLLGFGDAPKETTAAYDVFSQTARLHEFIKALSLSSFHLMGHSMGGAIAGAYGAAHPERVLSLTLMAPAGVKAAPDSELLKMLKKGENPFIVNTDEDFDHLMSLTFHREAFIPRPVRLFYAKSLKENQAIMKKTVIDLQSVPFALEDQVRRYPGPMLVIWGEEDRIVDVKGGTILANAHPCLVLKTLKNCGHMPMMEFPQETAGLYLGFLNCLKHS